MRSEGLEPCFLGCTSRGWRPGCDERRGDGSRGVGDCCAFDTGRSATSTLGAAGDAVTSSGEPQGGERGAIRSPVEEVR